MTGRWRRAGGAGIVAAIGAALLVGGPSEAMVHDVRFDLVSGLIEIEDEDFTVGPPASFTGAWNDRTGEITGGTLTIPPYERTYSGQTATITVTQVGEATGTIDRATGATVVDVSVQLDIDNPNVGSECRVPAFPVQLTTAAPGAPLDVDTGEATVQAGGFNVPAAQSCGIFTAPINNAIGLPTSNTNVELDMQQVADKPSAPRDPLAEAGNRRAKVSWKAPLDSGGALITGYKVRSWPEGKTCTTEGRRSCVVKGLTNGTRYEFTVRARNFEGFGPASVRSNGVKPHA